MGMFGRDSTGFTDSEVFGYGWRVADILVRGLSRSPAAGAP